jgi:hypothetical protein
MLTGVRVSASPAWTAQEYEQLKPRETAVAGVIFDDRGDGLPADPVYLAGRFGCARSDFDVVTYAIRKLGFVQVAPIRDALLIKFEPTTVRHLAAFAAFYEIAGRSPKRLILGSPGKDGSPDRYQIFNSVIEGLKRVEAALPGYQDSSSFVERCSEGSAAVGSRRHTPRETSANWERVAAVSGSRVRTIRAQAGDYSKRLSLPIDSISSRDEWLDQLLHSWRNARCGWRLPSNESLDPLHLLNIARGRAHIVDTQDSEPEGYRFRLWGTVNSYRGGHENKTLGEMPAGSMRDEAIEDYWEVATTGVPTYQLISHVENNIPYSYARLLLPLAADGRRVDQLVVLINERPVPELQASQPI